MGVTVTKDTERLPGTEIRKHIHPFRALFSRPSFFFVHSRLLWYVSNMNICKLDVLEQHVFDLVHKHCIRIQKDVQKVFEENMVCAIHRFSLTQIVI